MPALALATGIVSLLDNGVGFAKQILARTSPRELKELEKLEKERLRLTGLINDYMRLKPSERIQSRLEIYLSDHEKVCDEIIIMQKFAEQKLKLVLASYAPTDSVSSDITT